MSAIEFRNLCFQIFYEDSNFARFLVRQWHCMESIDHKKFPRLANFFEAWLEKILYEPICFTLQKDYFYLFKDCPIRYAWLSKDLQEELFGLSSISGAFKSVRQMQNGEFLLQDYAHKDIKEPFLMTVDPIWRRALVRHFFVILGEQKQVAPFLFSELAAAALSLSLTKQARGDMFLVSLLYGIRTGKSDFPLWGLSPYDLHSEDAFQKKRICPTLDKSEMQKQAEQ